MHPSRASHHSRITPVLLLLIAALVPALGRSTPASAATNPITIENQQPGSAAWRITLNEATDTGGQIKGYASATSVNKGGTIAFHISVNTPQTYSINVFRMGYYQGLGGRLMQTIGPLSGSAQPACPASASTGMIACAWAPSYSLAVPTSWTSGVYLALLTSASNFQSYIVFVVRDDGRVADLLYQQPVTTYQAYNNYPDNGTSGKSLYEYNSYGANTVTGTTRAAKVSFDRPYSNWSGAGEFLDWEIYFVRWLEQAGYDVSYSTNIDTHTSGGRLLSYKGFLSVGHDEYWTQAMFDAAVAARDSGRNLAFFSANDVYWQIRLESSAAGVPNRVITCYKDAAIDPVKDATATVNWRNAPANRAEQTLMGSQFVAQQPTNAAPASYVVNNSQHWIYAGTGVGNGSTIPGIVGYEADSYQAEYPPPPAVTGSYSILSISPFTTFAGGQANQNTTIYQAGSGAWVFNAGTTYWPWGLYSDERHSVADSRLQTMTANLLNRFIAASLALPAGPTNLAATASGGNSVQLSWADNASNETGYWIERSTSSGFAGATTISLPANSTSYLDSGLAAGATYYYRVYATNADGRSIDSNVASVSLIAYQQLVLRHSALLAYWRLGEASGVAALDSKGVYGGTYQGGVALGAAGAIQQDGNSAASFDGVNDTVTLPALPAVTNFTIEGWTFLNSAAAANENGNNALYAYGGNVTLLARSGSPNTASAAYSSAWVGGVEYSLQPTSTRSNLNTWVHWVLTRSGSTLTLYRNGVAIGQRSDLPAGGTVNVGASIGAWAGGAYFLNGRIDEVAVYGAALSAAEVAEHYSAALNGQPPTQPTATPTLTPTSTATTAPATNTPTSTATPSLTPTLTPTTAPATSTPTLTPTTAPATSTPTRTATAIPPTATSTAVPPSATPTWTPTPADTIFADGFESGNLSAWSSEVDTVNRLSVTSAAKLSGAFGVAAQITSNTAMYVVDDRPAAEARYRARFKFDPNSITMVNGDAHYVMVARSASVEVVRIELRRSANTYQVRASTRNNVGSYLNTTWYTISDAPHTIEFDWKAATSILTANGYLSLWIDGSNSAAPAQTLSNISSSTLRIEQARLGPLSGIDAGTRGTEYFDAFLSTRSTFIGP